MPTGYTSDIYEGKDLSSKNFILKCARAFGANIMLREQGLDVEIPVYEPSNTYLKWAEETKRKITELNNKTDDEIQKEINENYERAIKENKEAIQKNKELESRYLQVLNEVYNWKVPSDAHIELKEYAVSQLQDSIKFDCDTSHYENRVIEKETVEEYRISRMKRLLNDLERNTRDHQKEVERVYGRNEWNRLLKESLR